MKQLKWILLMVATVLVMTGCSAKAVYKDGTYNGSGDGKEGVIEVKILVESQKIKSIEVLGQNETQGVGAEAIQKIVNAIIEKQDPNVDVVSGATYSSKGIIEAVSMALEQAK